MLTIEEIVQSSKGKLIGVSDSSHITSVSTDTRTIEQGSLFLALRGKHYDGHQFLDAAFQKGAAAAIIDEKAYSSGNISLGAERCLIVVPDVYQALGQIAKFHREKFSIPIIAVTGSSGKTTTKECIRAILSQYFNVFASSGNFNNHIGLPLNLLRLTEKHQVAVLELGASSQGEIGYLCSIAKPTIGVITCIQPVHLEGFGSLEAIYQAKLELGACLSEHRGVLIINGDDPQLEESAQKFQVDLIRFGRATTCDYVVTKEYQDQDALRFTVNEKYAFQLEGCGLFNITNALAAIATCGHLGISLQEISEKWKKLASAPNRFEIENLSSPRVQLVKDCYNANPKSFWMALQSFVTLPAAGKRIVVAGDMKELGTEAEKYHKELGWQIAELPVDWLIAVGEYAHFIAEAVQERQCGIPTVVFANNGAAFEFLSSILKDGDSVLLKGSRSVKLEEIVELLKKERNISLAKQKG